MYSDPFRVSHFAQSLILCSILLLQKLTVADLLKKFPPFVEPECSLPCSQEPSAEPDEANPSVIVMRQGILRQCMHRDSDAR
jgi:hypothetical protein